MSMKLTVLCAAAVSSFIVFCLYFDRKRHQDPLLKQKLNTRRRYRCARNSISEYEEARQRFRMNALHLFQCEIGLAEEFARKELYPYAVQHFLNAGDICIEPAHLYNRIQAALPADLYQMVIEILQEKRNERKTRTALADLEGDDATLQIQYELNDDHDDHYEKYLTKCADEEL